MFGDRDPARGNKIIKGTGSPAAKAAVLAWCRNRGWNVPTHDVADACVLWEYDRRMQLSRLPTRDFAA